MTQADRERCPNLWDAVNEYAESCGGDTSATTATLRRMNAVAGVERAVAAKAETVVRLHAQCLSGLLSVLTDDAWLPWSAKVFLKQARELLNARGET